MVWDRLSWRCWGCARAAWGGVGRAGLGHGVGGAGAANGGGAHRADEHRGHPGGGTVFTDGLGKTVGKSHRIPGLLLPSVSRERHAKSVCFTGLW